MTKKELNKYLNEDWLEVLKEFVLSEKMDYIFSVLKQGIHVLPEAAHCFRAFNCCSWKQLKTVIIGQDPFHTIIDETPVANGLAFSSGVFGYTPPSLRNILKEAKVNRGLYDLYEWANQGVLLLNTALTVEEGNPGCHVKLWSPFTEFVLTKINSEKKNLIVMLWGNKAKAYKHLLTNQIVLEAGHPSPLNTSEVKFEGCNHFELCNQLLKEQKRKPIEW